MTLKDLERASSAVTLSDMEVFIFPELALSLVLANILSPRLWAWKNDPWFADIESCKPLKKLQRVRQYIMDNYVFNLDLDTWGLTTKEKELARFRDVISAEDLARSNALFGYEGDSYYFTIDIRTHFGLDKYSGDVIPYWKTETIEAMDAFRYREGYSTGAGECVSLAALYAAALYVIGGFPLSDIYLMATPLHSQNFADINGGILTNNRRLVTKSMWFNGTAISGQARRALENEKISLVAHSSGWIHTFYPRATIDPEAYNRFSGKLRDYLHTDLTPEILGCFLRQSPESRKCFYVRHLINGQPHYLPLEEAFRYEQECEFKFTEKSRQKLLELIPKEVYALSLPKCKLLINDVEDFLAKNKINISDPADLERFRPVSGCTCLEALKKFCHTEPQLPDPAEKRFEREAVIDLPAGLPPNAIREHLQSIRKANPTVELAFHALRDFNEVSPEPFLYAAFTRNPVCIEATQKLSDDEVIGTISGFVQESLYDGPSRFAQPDEVWNSRRGDGFELALTLAVILAARGRKDIQMECSDNKVSVKNASEQVLLTLDSRKTADRVLRRVFPVSPFFA